MDFRSESTVPYKHLEPQSGSYLQPTAPGLSAQHDMGNIPLGQFQQQPNNIVMMQSPAVACTPTIGLPKNPVVLTCLTCHQPVKSKVTMNNTVRTHFYALTCCIITASLCCWLPYCMRSCREATHTCPNCGSYMGRSVD